MKRVGWGIVGTGEIANEFMTALAHAPNCRGVAVVSRSEARGQAFAERWQLAGAHSSLAEMLLRPEVEAVYIATPHVYHVEQSLLCIAAGKAVLCEKPLATGADAATAVFEQARRAGVLVMEAFMYRFHPAIAKLLGLVASQSCGELKHIHACFGFCAPRDPHHRLFDPALGGGAILDVGGYPVSLARALVGARLGRAFAEPLIVEGSSLCGPTGVDEWSTALLSFEGGITAQVSCAIRGHIGTHLEVFGSLGRIVMDDPWLPAGGRQGRQMSIAVARPGQRTELTTYQAAAPLYALEASYVAQHVLDQKNNQAEHSWPAMSDADSCGNLAVLDAWRAG